MLPAPNPAPCAVDCPLVWDKVVERPVLTVQILPILLILRLHGADENTRLRNHTSTLASFGPGARQQRVEVDEQPGTTTAEATAPRDLRKRNRLLEQEVEVLRRATANLSQAHPPGK